MNANSKRERFGRYLILDHLVDGGMAKICRARFLGEQADKIVAIKMVQSQFSKDENFRTMFMDEIKVTFGLLHPNIIQTYDYGIHQGQLFVAMEYCDGKNLKEYLEKLKERKFVFPVQISTYIISQACQGLFYAHTFRDKLTGQESQIIHRDISPHNIMLTYDGSIKIIDFGIAKSQKSSEATQAGTIKGKLSYLAPEYLEGIELDARYDQFAIGITLWEMLCSRKLFKENNDLAVLKKIQECKIPAPSTINPNVPKELDEIVLKALSRDRNKRYENLDQMNRALMKFLYSKFPDFNSTDLVYFAQELFKDDIEKDREKLFEYGKIDIRPYLEELKKEALNGSNGEAASCEKEERQIIKKEHMLDFGFETEAEMNPTSTKSKRRTIGKNIKSSESSAITELADKKSSKTQVTLIKNNPIPRSNATRTKVEATRQTQIKKLEEKKKNSFAGVAVIALIIMGLAGFGAFKFFMGNEPNVNDIISKSDKKIKAKARKVASLDTSGIIFLSHFNKLKMHVYIDGKKEELNVESELKVPLNKSFTLRVQIEGRKHFIKEMIVKDAVKVEIEIPDMPPTPYGYIYTSTNCAKGEIHFELWGEKRQNPIPMQDSFGIALPLQIDEKGQAMPQSYSIGFTKEGETVERKLEVTLVREDETVDLCEKL